MFGERTLFTDLTFDEHTLIKLVVFVVFAVGGRTFLFCGSPPKNLCGRRFIDLGLVQLALSLDKCTFGEYWALLLRLVRRVIRALLFGFLVGLIDKFVSNVVKDIIGELAALKARLLCQSYLSGRFLRDID